MNVNKTPSFKGTILVTKYDAGEVSRSEHETNIFQDLSLKLLSHDVLEKENANDVEGKKRGFVSLIESLTGIKLKDKPLRVVADKQDPLHFACYNIADVNSGDGIVFNINLENGINPNL